MMETALCLGVAALGGLAVGVEREWSSSRGERAPRFAGVRTFLLLGLIGGLAADLHARGETAAGALLLAAAAALVVAAYVMAARGGDVDGTTEVAALVVLAGARFAVLALVVLPLLPEGPFGPSPGIRPRELWALVLLFSGLSFASFIALRLAGPGRGHGVAGLLGGLIAGARPCPGRDRRLHGPVREGGRAVVGAEPPRSVSPRPPISQDRWRPGRWRRG